MPTAGGGALFLTEGREIGNSSQFHPSSKEDGMGTRGLDLAGWPRMVECLKADGFK